MASAAYEVGSAHRAPQPSAPRVRVVRGGRYGLNKIKQLAHNVGLMLVAALVLGLVVSVVASQAKITELSAQIEATRGDLSTARSKYDYYSTQMDGITSRASVQDIAEGRLGLVKADSSQITYIRLEDQSVIEKTASNAAKLMDGFRTAALSLIGSFDP